MRILLVGAERPEVASAIAIAKAEGASLRQLATPEAAVETLSAGAGADLILADVDLAIDHLVRLLGEQRIFLPIVAYGVDTDAPRAVRAIRAGAREFLPLPPDPELIAGILRMIGTEQREVISEDPAMTRVLGVAEQIARSDASVLITGESGTGKEMVARHIHRKSRRHAGPLISVNCAAIPENLLESELFGHEKGAFTRATARRIGKFEEAHSSTLLLDEISEMDIRLQAKLLRAIQEREIDRVGGSRPIKIDIRVLATSNRDLRAEVEAGRFREDLLFRLNVVQLRLPPLRERPGDVHALAALFIRRYSRDNQLPERPLTPAVLARLKQHRWQGNVRELENCMHRAVLLATGSTIDDAAILLEEDPAAGQLAARPAGPAATLVGQSMAEVERRLILDTLDHTLGNRTQAATILGISIRTLRNKLRQYHDEGVAVTAPIPQFADRR
jgi:DNA-binding NtrC family response regulator